MIVSINSVPFGSTCGVMNGIAKVSSKTDRVVVATGHSSRSVEFPVEYIKIGGRYSRFFHMVVSMVTGANGRFSVLSTRSFLKKLDKLSPDILHLHNIHGWYINQPMLFKYIKKRNVKVVWTLHDCWSFTGHCPHFTMKKCDKWKTGCYNCPSYKEYPESKVDLSKKMYKLKKKWFTGVKDLVIVTPSEWLSGLVKQSFLKEYPVKVINNGIDLSVFKPTEGDFRERYGIPEEKKVLLGVSLAWGETKGLDVFVELSKRLDPERYQIVLIGTDDNTDKQLPDNIISIHRTHDQRELAQIYTASDLFVNPTREDNYPTVNMEALACGTPVLTFRTGGSPEIIDDSCGAVVDCDDVGAMEKEIVRICEQAPYSKEACLERAKGFASEQCFEKYVQLYNDMKGTEYESAVN